MQVFQAPRGAGPYGIIQTWDGGRIFYASLAGSHIAEINLETASPRRSTHPRPARAPAGCGPTRRATCGSASGTRGRWAATTRNSGEWREWKLPGSRPQAYAVYVDEIDKVWLTDFGANAIVRFDPVSESFESFELPGRNAAVRQLLGRAGEVWGAESGLDKLVVIRH